jgi:hypothetical protein
MTQRPRRSTAPFALIMLAGVIFASASAVAAPPAGTPAPPTAASPFVNGRAALERLGDRLPSVAAAHGVRADELERMILDDAALVVDLDGDMAYVDAAEPGAQAATATDPLPSAAPPVGGPEFQLASLPGAEKTIFLDFDGHITEGTSWNSSSGLTTITSPPYDTDGDPGSWSAGELQVIRDSWASATEDFAPWNVNVTTIDPGAEALSRSGTGDTRWGARVVITDDTFANCGCGGHAYVGAFDDVTDEPTFVYNQSFAGVAEAITHEVGHMLGLFHDGTTTGDAYYLGHDGSGSPGWAPIMGAAYYYPVTQWSRQEYFQANNTTQDDVAIIGAFGNGNDFGVRADDHGDDLATSTVLTTEQVSVAGAIATRADVDVFSFTTPNGADVSFVVDLAPVRPNLDVELTLRDAGGTVLAVDNAGESLVAGFDAAVGPGTYSVTVAGVGAGTPGVSPPSGYTDYGSLGQFTLLGYIGGLAPPDTVPPAAPSGLSGDESDGTVMLSWLPNTESDLAGYVVERDSGGGFSDLATVGNVPEYVDTTPPAGDAHYRVVAIDTAGNRSAASEPVTVTIPVDLSQTASGELAVAGTVGGTITDTTVEDGRGQSITEVDSGGRPASRHDRAEHIWTMPASNGDQTLRIVAQVTDGGDLDAGFAFEWSPDGSTWIPVTRVTGSVAGDFPIGAPNGPIQIRVIDTDRTAGQRGHDTVTIDLLRLDGGGGGGGGGGPVDPPSPTMALATISTSLSGAGKGEQRGVATVRVNDDLGGPIAGAAVTVNFTGDLTGTVSGTTGVDGTVALTSPGSARKPSFGACVVDVAPLDPNLPYAPGTEGC